jgi:hypothetical protein
MRALRWLIVPIAIILILLLGYFVVLTARPLITDITPQPNAVLDPGPVQIGAMIDSQRAIESATLLIDGQEVEISITQVGGQRWSISYESVLDHGEHELWLTVVDESGRSAEHRWRVQGSGPLVPPRVVLGGPPHGSVLQAGQIVIWIKGTTFGPLGSVDAFLNEEQLAVGVDDRSGVNTEYTSDNGMPVYQWIASAPARISAGEQKIRFVVRDVYGAETEQSWTFRASVDRESADTRFFSETSLYMQEPFLSFWLAHNGERIFGPPVGSQFVSEDGRLTQYFRFARFEYNDERDEVMLGHLGREVFGPPEQPPPGSPPSDSRLFTATGHFVHGPMREFWENNGGLFIFGYPISQAYEIPDGFAQYFERVRLEVVVGANGDERVRIAPLGEEFWAAYGEDGPPTFHLEAGPSPTTDALLDPGTVDVEGEFFSETSLYVQEPFLSYWHEHDGERNFGPPVSPQFVAEDGTLKQYFRYARFEYDEENDEVVLGHLAREVFGSREPPPTGSPPSDARVFSETGHSIRGPIREFYEEHGGILLFGFPISQESATEFGREQYFERVRLEVFEDETGTEQVRIAALGEELWAAYGEDAPPSND